MENHEKTLKALNALGPNWSAQFDSAPALSLVFTEDDLGMLSVNGEPICRIGDVDPETTFISEETLGFGTVSGDEYRIIVDWPFEGAPRISRLAHIHFRALKDIAN